MNHHTRVVDRARRALGWVLAALVVVVLGVAGVDRAEPAQALSGSSFDPGYIISDARFFDNSAMTEAEIQSFLNAKIGACQNSLCLNVYRQATADRVADKWCAAYPGAASESAASIIYKVQRACGISAMVILVTLQKEQGLVTKKAPTESAMRIAMGYGCPDTSACDALYFGFQNQVYSAARQFVRYGTGSLTWYPIGAVSRIGYHPNAACGAQNVVIRNRATAALYYYTPYTPNAAALANLGGVGDSCSSYGNRNFWVYFNNWFGSPVGPPPPATNNLPFVLGRDRQGTLWLYAGDGRTGWSAVVKIGEGWAEMRALAVAGDVTGDGNRDILAIDGAGVLWAYPTDGWGGVGSRTQLLGGLGQVRSLVTPGDLTGDGRDDILIVDGSGRMTLYPSLGAKGLGAGQPVAGDWSSAKQVIGVGDFDSDRRADLMSIDEAGDLWYHRGDGAGAFAQRTKVGNGWNSMDQILGIRDFDGDGKSDLVARDPAGDLWLFRGDGRGGGLAKYKVGNGWQMMDLMVASGAKGTLTVPAPGIGDGNGDGARDVLAIDGAGAMWLYAGNGASSWGGRFGFAGNWSDTRTVVGVGDMDGDGYNDAVTVDKNGEMWLYRITSAGLTSPKQIGNGWGSMTSITSFGDFDGDGVAEIMAVNPSGDLVMYAMNAQGLLVPRVVGTGWNTMTTIIGGGDFDGDGNVDVLARTVSGDLIMYGGDGKGDWASAGKVGVGWNIFTRIIGTGDFSGDGKPDVLAEDAKGNLWLYPGNGRGDWLAWSQIGWGWQTMRWIG